MQSLPRLAHRSYGRALLGLSAFLSYGAALAPQASFGATPRQSELWQRAIENVSKGEFQHAAETLRKVRINDELVTQVRTWLEEFEVKQAARRELDQADFDKYVGYAKARVERKEHSRALGWALWALNTTTDREEFLASPWLLELVNASLAKTDELRQEDDWRGVWGLYSQLASLYEREPRYEKLERQALTHLRLESMFGKKSKWKERIEKVIWRDAERALKEIDRAYVEPADFRRIAESGLEQMLLLADSKTAREHEDCKGLADEDSRRHFKLRVQARLDQVRAATKIDHKDCVGYFRRGIQINKETVALPEELVVSELMRGALDVLDDYTTIIWPSASDEFDKHTRGDFVGVGISISKHADGVEVITPMDGGPAYAAGIQAGDIITHVDGTSLKDFSINKVVETITGETGTPVTLTIRRGEESLDFDLIRRRVHIVSVKGHHRNTVDEERWDYWLDRERGIGYIRLTNFARNTFEDLQNALSELPHLQGLILDLRGNPGGLLDSAWNVASLFLERGDVVVSTKGRISDDDKTFPANSTGSYAGFPLIVLVDNRSASASEIVSGAIRDNGRGTVVGERTFGKFSVQNLVQLNRRSGAKLKITTARYYLPN
ncbi:MAG: S41 family peptidase, partial [Planctomycetes bacterium]|nr:S41 family peptidase [Planctomycetota bacterium]